MTYHASFFRTRNFHENTAIVTELVIRSILAYFFSCKLLILKRRYRFSLNEKTFSSFIHLFLSCHRSVRQLEVFARNQHFARIFSHGGNQ